MGHSTLRLRAVVFGNRIVFGFIVQYRSVPGPVAGITTSQSSSRPPVEESSPAHIEIRLSTQLGSTPIFCAISSVDIPERRRRSTSSSRQTSPLFSMTYLPFNDGSMEHHYQLTRALKPQQEAWRRAPIYLARRTFSPWDCWALFALTSELLSSFASSLDGEPQVFV